MCYTWEWLLNTLLIVFYRHQSPSVRESSGIPPTLKRLLKVLTSYCFHRCGSGRASDGKFAKCLSKPLIIQDPVANSPKGQAVQFGRPWGNGLGVPGGTVIL